VSRHLDEAVTFELAQVVAQLVEAVGGLGEIKGGEDGMVDLPARPAARLARDGDPEPVDFRETETAYVVAWPGKYRIEGPAFVYTDRR
jgi:hypothetical protein